MASMHEPLSPHEPAGPPGNRVLRLIHWTSAAGRNLRRRLASVAEAFCLSDQELLVVWLCSHEGRVQGELAAAVGVSPAQMSGVVERLRQRGLVERQRSPLDRRRQVWRTSDAGSDLLAAAAPLLEQLEATLGQRLPEQEQAAAEGLCRALAEAASPEFASPQPAAGSEQQGEQHASKEAA
jgi:DNA-binding MarR family transcriptional regulator